MKVITIPKRSASLLLARRMPALVSRTSRSNSNLFYDYQLLMMQRKAKLSFGSVLVFPGGKYQEDIDEELAKQFGYAESLVATALRECFQEAGIYLTEQAVIESHKIDHLKSLGQRYIAGCLREGEQELSHEYMYELAKEIKPISKLQPLIRLITVSFLQKRYDTTFFMHRLQDYKFINFLRYVANEKDLHDQQNIIKCENEYECFRWMNPAEILGQYWQGSVKLAPPQFMMVNLMLNFSKYDDFLLYVRNCHNPAISDPKYQNLALGPNIVQLIKNKSPSSSVYPFAATLIGDHQFPYSRILQTQKCPYLLKQIQEWQQHLQGISFPKGKHRFLFPIPKQFFQEDYSFESEIPYGILTKFSTYEQARKVLEGRY